MRLPPKEIIDKLSIEDKATYYKMLKRGVNVNYYLPIIALLFSIFVLLYVIFG